MFAKRLILRISRVPHPAKRRTWLPDFEGVAPSAIEEIIGGGADFCLGANPHARREIEAMLE